MTTPVAPNPAIDLTTLALVKQYLTITPGLSTSDDLLQNLITNESKMMQSWMERTINIATHTEIRNGQGAGAQQVPVKNTPIVSVASFAICGQALAQVPINNFSTQGYRFYEDTIYLNFYTLVAGIANIQFTYSAGFAEVPFDLQQAATELVGFRYQERQRQGKKSETLAGQVTAYNTKAFPDSVLAVMWRYKRVIMGA